MTRVQNFPSRMEDPRSRRLGTFSYLPPLSRDQLRRQVEYMLAQGWSCSVEHVEPARATSTYWCMWKLPMFGQLDPQVVMAELDACRKANPDDHVRLIGYDRRRQTVASAFVVYR